MHSGHIYLRVRLGKGRRKEWVRGEFASCAADGGYIQRNKYSCQCFRPSSQNVFVNFVAQRAFATQHHHEYFMPASCSTQCCVELPMSKAVLKKCQSNAIQRLTLRLVHRCTVSRYNRKLSSLERKRQSRIFGRYFKSASRKQNHFAFLRPTEQSDLQ